MTDPQGRFIHVNGTNVFVCITVHHTLFLDESTSEQCEGCGLDIIDTGHAINANSLVVCGTCSAVYPVYYATRQDDGRCAYDWPENHAKERA